MAAEDRINIDLFKVVTRAISVTDDIEDMSHHLTQLLVGALGIKGATLFLLNPESGELEILASFGLSTSYINKGPILIDKGIDRRLRGEPIVIKDVSEAQSLQYPDDARREGIGAIVSVPVKLSERLIGRLRLYHYEPWEISERDLDSLQLLAETIALALMYIRLLHVFKSVKERVSEVHEVWTG